MNRLSLGNETGFTLVEVLVAVALSALIGVAGFTVVENIVRVQLGTDKELDRLAELQRAMHLMTLDFEQIADGGLSVSGTGLFIVRIAPSRASGEIGIRYDFTGQNLYRTVNTAGSQPRVLIGGVSAVQWQFYTTKLGWIDSWPLPESKRGALPRAIAVELTLAPNGSPLAGQLRRVVELSDRPDE